MKRLLLAIAICVGALSIPGAAFAGQSGDKGGGKDAHQRQPTRFFTSLSGAREVPPVATEATGRITIRLGKDGIARYRVTFEDIHGVIAAHIHAPARPGSNAGVVQFLCGSPAVGAPPGTPACTDEGFSGSFRMTPALLAFIRSGAAYVNAHTPAHPGGEVRGWLRSRGDD
ncbi:MAG: CHRD domain-containing protein [Candidatus Dormibacteraeota bacterium]|nr:CHRD domain-containing protein [Candidatus Dormibacteraeota bacterium]